MKPNKSTIKNRSPDAWINPSKNQKLNKQIDKKQKPNTMRDMEINVPYELMTEVADLIEKADIANHIVGTENERITVAFSYNAKQRNTMMEILELIEDFDSEDDDEDDDDEDEDED